MPFEATEEELEETEEATVSPAAANQISVEAAVTTVLSGLDFRKRIRTNNITNGFFFFFDEKIFHLYSMARV